jgi:thiomorpholine-carboxylate dehydrogenase
MGVMPCVYGDMMGAKLVSLFEGNAGSGLPTHQAMIALLSAKTGEPLVTMDGRLITEMRTAAVSAVALDALARKDVRSLAILGSGVQAGAHFRALSMVRKFDDVRVWSRTASHADLFAREIGAKATSLEDALRGADVVASVSSAHEPVVRGELLKADAVVLAVGSVGPANRELDDAAMRDAAVVVESRESSMKESGDIVHSGAEIFAEIGEILSGKIPAPERGKRIVFKSLGIAATDIAAAKLAYERLRA